MVNLWENFKMTLEEKLKLYIEKLKYSMENLKIDLIYDTSTDTSYLRTRIDNLEHTIKDLENLLQ